MLLRLDIIAGARPNFMKVAPLIHRIQNIQKKENVTYRLIHTGQHYDRNMSGSFFEQLGIPEPDENLEVGSGTQAEQTAGIMTRYEYILQRQKPDICIVVGDVTSTLACSVTAKKMGIRVAHIEGGIRSGDWTMPEEINRVVTDSITDYFFTTSETANQNLKKEGVAEDQIFFVGNTMIDTLFANIERLQKPGEWEHYNLTSGSYFVMTLHRPANVDEQKKLKRLIENIVHHSGGHKIIFPVHPRTRKMLEKENLVYENLLCIDPLGYLEFNYLVKNARAVITDSGGITEEATVMSVPCLTLRDNTERPETVQIGTNELIGTDPDAIKPALEKLLAGKWKKGKIPDKWDGKTSERIVYTLLSLHKNGMLKPFSPHVDHTLLFQPAHNKE